MNNSENLINLEDYDEHILTQSAMSAMIAEAQEDKTVHEQIGSAQKMLDNIEEINLTGVDQKDIDQVRKWLQYVDEKISQATASWPTKPTKPTKPAGPTFKDVLSEAEYKAAVKLGTIDEHEFVMVSKGDGSYDIGYGNGTRVSTDIGKLKPFGE